jgi:hypothetical protein
VIAGASTAAVLFRLIEAVGGTVLLDEADFSNSQIGSDVIKILNCGYRKGLPIIRAEADAKGQYIPRLYETFGPKIINGRKPFRDEATESRCLTYKPSSTTRDDIPRQLPAEFEQEALAIRNRAMAWRFAALEALEVHNVKLDGLSPRTNEITIPLFSIAMAMSEGFRERYVKDLLAFARGADQQARALNRDTVEAALVHAYVNTPWTTPPTCAQLRTEVLKAEGAGNPRMEQWLTAKFVGAKMREMGFQTVHTNRGTTVIGDPDRVTQLCARYGIVTSTQGIECNLGDDGDSAVIQ